MMKRPVCATGLSLAVVTFIASSLVPPRSAQAVPTFARKYETSCVTCHVGYPKLNSFGEAFRINGYQYPADDEGMTKDDPVSLGAEAYKRVFPEAVWPNDIPGKPPISLRVGYGFTYEKEAQVETRFNAISLNLMSAGTLGTNTGFFAGAHLFEEGEVGSIDRAFLNLGGLFNWLLPERALGFRLGQFIPGVVAFANHRGLALTPYAFNTYSALQDGFEAGHAHGESDTFGIESFQLGVEASGIIQRRWRWVAGMVNGSGPVTESNSAKDGYGRALVKIGGMGLDGSGGRASQSANNWVDDSITLGVFGYLGSRPNDELTGPQDLTFDRWGVDANVLLWDLNLFGGYINGSDEAISGTQVVDLRYDLAFAEVNYVVFPWLVGLARYEQANPEVESSIKRIVAGATTLYRANIKFALETALDPDDGGFSNLMVRLDFAM